MENFVLTAKNAVCYLRQNCSSRNMQIIELLENVETHERGSQTRQIKVLDELLQIVLSGIIDTSKPVDGVIFVNFVILMTYLQEQQKLPCLNDSQFVNLWQWLLDQYKCNQSNIDVLCRVITCIANLFIVHSEISSKYFPSALRIILKNISINTAGVLLITSLQCLYKILSNLKEAEFSDEQRTECVVAGQKLLQLYYGDIEPIVDSHNISIAILCSFEILHKIIELNTNFVYIKTAELLGLSKTYFNFGVDALDASLLKPKKVSISQMAFNDSPEDFDTMVKSEQAKNYCGKTKNRKPRAVMKNSRTKENKVISLGPANRNTFILDMNESDTGMSEPEFALKHILLERSRKVQIRLASISLVGLITRILDRKTRFACWQALFPNGTANSVDNLLYIGQHDPDSRCRSEALQVCAHLIYGSKGYLHQAEINIKRCPTAFIPFSVSLGYTILAIYKALITIISSETSLPVLTQALKSMAVLVQASPIKQFEKGFVQDIVKVVKPLVYHRDCTVQVSALTVMESLITLPETACELVEALGFPQEAAKQKITKLHVVKEEIDFDDIDNNFKSEEDIFVNIKTEISNTQDADEASWLLRRVLNNLSKKNKVHPTSVRIESLQVLIAISSYFPIIKPHLMKVFEVLLYSLNDILPDVRLYAARCVDAFAYQISRYLLDNADCCEVEIHECNNFWRKMMPFIMNKIRRDAEEMITVRITLCDALSNIGVVIFEHTSHCTQISLLSFLSGVSSDSSEETVLRAAGVRALAVFALYPSLRSDLVFIENTAELTLRLVKDSNFPVRVKSFWSLGNISEALVGKIIDIGQSRQERISDDLLFRLITAATTACNDNDKVRWNAVRTLGNLLNLLSEEHFNSGKLNWSQIFWKSICKLDDCIRSSGNAKVKWNTCYAISNLMRNTTIFKLNDLNWQQTLFSVLCHIIVHHSNFKVRISASAAITNITERTHFGDFYDKFWSSVLEAIEQSYNLDNFQEYNHRDNLQEQLCLSLSHIIKLASNDDLPMLNKQLYPRVEIIRNTWKRVINRMVPEKAAPLLSCPVFLLERVKHRDTALASEQKNILDFLIEIFRAE